MVCNECFRNADHEGHEVFFFYSNTEGCCDCGDENVWAASGFCSRHALRILPPGHTPVGDLPPTLVTRAEAILGCLVRFVEEVALEAVARYGEPSPDRQALVEDPDEDDADHNPASNEGMCSLILHPSEARGQEETAASLAANMGLPAEGALAIAQAVAQSGDMEVKCTDRTRLHS